MDVIGGLEPRNDAVLSAQLRCVAWLDEVADKLQKLRDVLTHEVFMANIF